MTEPIVGFARHPAAMERQAARSPAYTPGHIPVMGTNALGWSPAARFAPPGPSELCQPMLDTVVLLQPAQAPPLDPPAPRPVIRDPELAAEPAARPAVVEETAPWPEPVVADHEPEPLPPLSADATPLLEAVEEVEPWPEPNVPEPEPEPEPSPPAASRPQPPLPPLAEWAARYPREPLAVAPVAPAAPAPARRGSVRDMPVTAPGDELLWPGMPPRSAPAPTSGDRLWPAEPAASQTRFTRRPQPLRQVAVAAGAVAIVFGVMVVAIRLLPAWFAGGSVPAVFNAPMMVVRAAVTGRVTAIAANAGEMVDATSPLLTIHTDDAAHPDKSVLAGVHGVIRSVETVPGADLTAGSPLVRLHDCDRAFLTVAPDAKLTAGEAVQVKLPNLPPIAGTVRASAGIMEPPNSLVVGLPPGAMPSVCPVGATASVTAAAKG